MKTDYYRRGLNYWTNDRIEDTALTVEEIMRNLKEDERGYRRKEERDGEIIYKYAWGDITIRGRYRHGLAYKLTILPKGILKKTVERNFRELRDILESSGIKLTRIENE